MPEVEKFPQVLSLRGHFVDQNGKKWTVEVPQALLEVHFHHEEIEPWSSPILWANKTTSQYCLRLVKDPENGSVLKITQEESKVEV